MPTDYRQVNCWLWWLLKFAGQAIAAWLALSLAAVAAEPMGLDFELANAKPVLPAESSIANLPPAIDRNRLPVASREIPIGSETPKPLPPPPQPDRSTEVKDLQSPLTPPKLEDSRTGVAAIEPRTEEAKPSADANDKLDFALRSSASAANLSIDPVAQNRPALAPVPSPTGDLFAGDSDSLVAKVIGSAEGTRTPTGGYTWAYRGHVDPGNGAWNLGSFSYQHGANSPQEADRRQLSRLRTQAQTLRQQADRYEIRLTLAETLNGLDLANQSPRAALSRGGYIDRLHQAHDMGLQGADAILWARTRAFLDPNTNRWNAPGLGNNVYSITADQDRRRRSIEQAIAYHSRR